MYNIIIRLQDSSKNRFKIHLLATGRVVLLSIFILNTIICLSLPTYSNQKSVNDSQVVKSNPALQMVPFSMKWENSKDSKLNLSFLNEKPAGKNGFISIKDGHFVKPTGERFKIWGVNLTGGACFPEKKDAPLVAAYLARLGINCVRLHYMDATLSHIYSNWKPEQMLFDNSKNTTRELFPESLDKLDFLISELKKVGIYSDINLNVGRFFKLEDGVNSFENLGLSKAVTLFDDRIIDLQKEFAKQLLTHINPYTGNAYTNEPAVALVEIVNENSLVEAWISGRLLGNYTKPGAAGWHDIPPYYGNELTEKYNAWLKKNISASDITQIEQECGVKSGEVIPRLKPVEFKNASKLRFYTEAKFIVSTERAFYSGMYNYLKKDLKVKAPLIGNSDSDHKKSPYALLSNLALLDVVDSHVYWQHPNPVKDKITGKSYSAVDNTAMVNDPEHSTVVELSRSAVEGKPFTVSEYNHPSPNEYACEGFPIISAYGSMQDWDGIFGYTFEHVSADFWNTNYALANSGAFDMGMDPIRMSTFAASGILFLRNDITASKSSVYRGYSDTLSMDGIRESSKNKPYFTKGFSLMTPLIEKTRIKSFTENITDFPSVGNLKEIESKTGELKWNVSDKSFVEVATPKTESLIGYIPEKSTMLKHLQLKIQNEFASIMLTSVDNQTIASSEKLLLVTTGRGGMTGMKWGSDRKYLVEPGAKPTTIEVIQGTITISGLINAKTMLIEPLDGAGNPIKSISVKVKKGIATFTIGNDATVWYLLTMKR